MVSDQPSEDIQTFSQVGAERSASHETQKKNGIQPVSGFNGSRFTEPDRNGEVGDRELYPTVDKQEDK
uniref:Uncharacterized protein n=1 Tax=Peronospora matthiolae TaxID=2874970 RepID=A0AAV1ULH6_9STRA